MQMAVPRFSNATVEQIEASTIAECIANTDIASRTAKNLLQSWLDEKKMDDDLTAINIERLNEILPQFILEARKGNGDSYPAHIYTQTSTVFKWSAALVASQQSFVWYQHVHCSGSRIQSNSNEFG